MLDFKTWHILIVDDEPDNLALLKTLFNHFNAQVTSASNGADCMKLLAGTYFDLILLDIQMPLKSGETILSEIRAHTNPEVRSTPVIAVTAKAMSGDRERLLNLGFNDYIAKPFDVQSMAELAQKNVRPRTD